jgi:CheY-like chemotaxis protein
MDVTYLIIEMILAAIFATLTLALSERFLRAGIRRWGWILTGLVLIIAADVVKAAFSVQSFARLFVPEISLYVAGSADFLRLLGLVTVLLTFFLSALRLYRLRIEDRRKEDNLKLLDIIRDTINQSLSLIELLNFSIRELVRGTDSKAGCVFIYNPNQEELVLAAHRDLPRELEKRLDRISDTGSIFMRTQKSNKPHVIGNIGNADRETSRVLGDAGFKSLLVVPLLGRNESFGAAVLFCDESYYYSREQIQLISSSASILGPAVAAFRLERELRDISRRYKVARNSDQFMRELFKVSIGMAGLRDSLTALFELASSRLEIKTGRIYEFQNGRPDCVYPGQGKAELSDDMTEHVRNAILKNKSLLVRTRADDQLDNALIIPLKSVSGKRRAMVLILASAKTEPDQNLLEKIRALAGTIELQFKIAERKSEFVISDNLGGIGQNELNNLNNILTGILGNAQLLGLNLKKEQFPGKSQTLSSLDKIADEAFQAGELIKKMQSRVASPIQQPTDGTALETVIASLGSYDKSGGEAKYVIRDNPSIHFDFKPRQSGFICLTETDTRDILSSLFAWLENKWRPQSDLYIKLFNSEAGIHFLIGDHPPPDIIRKIDEYDFKSFALFPDPALASRLSHKPVMFHNTEDISGRLMILRFPGVEKPLEAEKRRALKQKILAIDDQELIRELLTSMLDELDYPHQICADGESGIRAFEQDNFDIVITDLGLPGMDGWEVARRVKQLKPATPVIVISGWGIDAVRRKAPANLVDFILAKPFRMEQLGEMISAAEGMEARTAESE